MLWASEPDGKNINDECGSEHPEGLIEKVLKTKADLGLAFDGDGDRLTAVDEKGGILSGDQILAICAKDLKQKGRVKKMIWLSAPSWATWASALHCGIWAFVTRLAPALVTVMSMEKMMATGAILGGEDSGHMIFAGDHTSGDGILTALKLIEAMQTDQPTPVRA